MNWDKLEVCWRELRAEAETSWASVTEGGQPASRARDQLIGKIQQRYGIPKEEAEKQVSGWMSKAMPPPVCLRTPLASTQM